MAKTSRPSNKREARVRPDVAATAASVEIIVKVHKPHYVPAGVTVRAQISPVLFTSVVAGADLPDLERDTGVQSVAISHPLRTIG